MECDDFKEFLELILVKIRLFFEIFGDVLMVLEFFNVFGEFFDF